MMKFKESFNENTPEPLLETWPEHLPTKVLYRFIDGDGAPYGDGFEIVVTDEGIDLSGLPEEVQQNLNVGGLPDEFGNRARPKSEPVKFMTSLIRNASRRWHIEFV